MGISDDRFIYAEEKRNQLYKEAGYLLSYINYYKPERMGKMTFELKVKDNDLEKVVGGTKIPYIINDGDTLAKLAEVFKVSIEDICKWNKIKNPDKIETGKTLYFYY